MINFENITEARTWLRELDEETTAEYGDYSVMEYSNGEIELIAIGEEIATQATRRSAWARSRRCCTNA